MPINAHVSAGRFRFEGKSLALAILGVSLGGLWSAGCSGAGDKSHHESEVATDAAAASLLPDGGAASDGTIEADSDSASTLIIIHSQAADAEGTDADVGIADAHGGADADSAADAVAIGDGANDGPEAEASICGGATPNACGGCNVLVGQPLAPCTGSSTCPGVYQCEDPATVTCVAPELNACGGCAPLSGTPGHACTGADGCGGLFECNGLNAVVCKLPDGVPNICGGCTPVTGNPRDVCNVSGRALGACRNGGMLGCSGAGAAATLACAPIDPAIGTSAPKIVPAPNGDWDWDCDGTVEATFSNLPVAACTGGCGPACNYTCTEYSESDPPCGATFSSHGYGCGMLLGACTGFPGQTSYTQSCH